MTMHKFLPLSDIPSLLQRYVSGEPSSTQMVEAIHAQNSRHQKSRRKIAVYA